MLAFADRNCKEILRDPITVSCGLGFPVVLILLLSAIQANIPVELFVIERLAPGITVFGLSFMTLFSASLIARDRESAFLDRLYTTPLTASDFILGYTLPLLPISLAQAAVCYLLAFPLGMEPTIGILQALVGLIPIALLYISLGLLFGSVLNVKQVGGICGTLLTNLSAWLSGIWFDLQLVGGWFETVADLLPFAHAVELERALCSGQTEGIWSHLAWVIGYAVLATVAAVMLFLRQMKK